MRTISSRHSQEAKVRAVEPPTLSSASMSAPAAKSASTLSTYPLPTFPSDGQICRASWLGSTREAAAKAPGRRPPNSQATIVPTCLQATTHSSPIIPILFRAPEVRRQPCQSVFAAGVLPSQRLPLATNPVHLPLVLVRGGVLEPRVIAHLNGPGTTPREMLGDRDPRKSLLLQLTYLLVVRWRVSRTGRTSRWPPNTRCDGVPELPGACILWPQAATTPQGAEFPQSPRGALLVQQPLRFHCC